MTYYPTIMIGIGNLGNRTLQQVHQTFYAYDRFVQLRGFHLNHANAPAWSYNLLDKANTPPLTRAEMRQVYVQHLQHYQHQLLGHIKSAVAQLKDHVFVYFFTDLSDIISALLLDIVHVVYHVLTRHDPNMAIRPFLYVAAPSDRLYDAGQFATLREWLRFSYVGNNKPQRLFEPESSFKFLNIDHTILFNRLFLYQSHQHLPQLWTDVMLAQLQDVPVDIPNDRTYSRTFIEHNVSNFSSQAQMKRITLTQEINILNSESMLLCSAFVAYSLGLPITYLHDHWRLTFASEFIKRCVGQASSETHMASLLSDFAQRIDIPPFIDAHLRPLKPILAQLKDDELVQSVLSRHAFRMLSDEVRQFTTLNQLAPPTHITNAAEFINHYDNRFGQMVGDLSQTDWTNGHYAQNLSQCADITLRDVERSVHSYLVRLLNQPLEAPSATSGGLDLALQWLTALRNVLYPLQKDSERLIQTVESQLRTNSQLRSIYLQQLQYAQLLTNRRQLTPVAANYHQFQLQLIQLKRRYDTVRFVQQVITGILTILDNAMSALSQWHMHLNAHLNALEQRLNNLKRPTSHTFCHWIQDEEWEKSYQQSLWEKSSNSWRRHIHWTIDNQTGHLLFTVGGATAPLAMVDGIHLEDWLSIITFPRDETLWMMYAKTKTHADQLFKKFTEMIKKVSYQPLDSNIQIERVLIMPFYSPNEAGATHFWSQIKAHLDLNHNQPYITPTGDKITYLVRYEEYPLQTSRVYNALAEQYQQLADPDQHHALLPERTARRYERHISNHLLLPPIVALFENSQRLKLFCLLHMLDAVCELTEWDGKYALGVMLKDGCMPLTIPDDHPSLYDAVYTFVCLGWFWTYPTCPIDYPSLQRMCDDKLAQQIEAHVPINTHPHWKQVQTLSQVRPNKRNQIHRLGVLLDIYIDYQKRLERLSLGQTPVLADLKVAFMAINAHQIEQLQRELSRYQL